jgi:hypothetical protein
MVSFESVVFGTDRHINKKESNHIVSQQQMTKEETKIVET